MAEHGNLKLFYLAGSLFADAPSRAQASMQKRRPSPGASERGAESSPIPTHQPLSLRQYSKGVQSLKQPVCRLPEHSTEPANHS